MSEPKMTLDEMIKAMNGHLVEMREAAPQIIAALRAAERINEMLNYVGIHEDESSSALMELAQARDEWDAATKDGKDNV